MANNLAFFPPEFTIISSLTPHKSLSPEQLDDFDSFLLGCDCSSTGCNSTVDDTGMSEDDGAVICSCDQRSPIAYLSDRRIRKEYLEPGNLQPPVIECGQLCGCGLSCVNRLVGCPASRGNGLKTLRPIPSGSFVCEYAGEVISLEEAAQRTAKSPDDTLIFTIHEQISAANGLTGIRTCIDARRMGNIGRFINHSCQPNLVMIPVRIDINIPRLAFFAKETISAGDELSTDYGQTSSGGSDLTGGFDGKQRQLTVCRCDQPTCRGYLPYQADIFTR